VSSTPAAARAAFAESHRRLGWVLLAIRARAARNALALHRRNHRVRAAATYFVAAPGLLLLTLLLTVFVASVLGGMASERAATSLLAALLTVAAIGSFVGASMAALQALYLADDVPFLLTLPIPLRVLFVGKFADSLVGALPACTLLLASLVGYGLARTTSDLYVVAAFAVGVTLAAGITAAAIAAVSVVARFVPPRRARLYLLLLAVGIILLALLTWQYAAPSASQPSSASEELRYESLYAKFLLIPTGWAAEGLTQIGHGHRADGAISVLLFMAFTIALLGLAFEAFSRSFVSGLARTRAIQTRAGGGPLAGLAMRASRLLPPGMGPLVAKEWLCLFRDLKRLSGAIWPVGVVLIYSVLLARRGPSAADSAEMRFWSTNATMALLPWGLSLGISLYAYGSEARNISLLRSLPLSARGIFLGKATASAVPVLIGSFAAIWLGLLARGAGLAQFWQMTALTVWMAIGFVVIDTAASAAAPAFGATQIQRAVDLAGRAFSFALGGAFSIFTAVAAARLVLMREEPPAELASLLSREIGGIQPLGWPLVAGAMLAAGLTVVFAATIGVRQTERLLRDGD
jgi:hypothetical protein